MNRENQYGLNELQGITSYGVFDDSEVDIKSINRLF